MAEKLLDYKLDIQRGDIIRCKGNYPYENIVDFLVSEIPGEKKFCLIVSSGYKAGLVFSTLPASSIPEDNLGYAIKKEWLIDNWENWGYYECPLSDVYLIENAAPESIDS